MPSEPMKSRDEADAYAMVDVLRAALGEAEGERDAWRLRAELAEAQLAGVLGLPLPAPALHPPAPTPTCGHAYILRLGTDGYRCDGCGARVTISTP